VPAIAEEAWARKQHCVVARGAEAIDNLFGRGRFSLSDTECVPRVILLDLRLPTLVGGCNLGAKSFVVKPVEFVDEQRLG
jgi:hypothetical protein